MVLWKKLSEGSPVTPGLYWSFMSSGGNMIQLSLTHDEAQDLFFRCLRSPDEDNPLSELVLSKLARALAEAGESDFPLAA